MKLNSTALAAILISISSFSAQATLNNLVYNGDFELTSNGVGQLGAITNATGWTSDYDATHFGFNFILDKNADKTGFASENTASKGTNIFMWGPQGSEGRFSDNGFKQSHNGGNFLGSDGAYANTKIWQNINNLVIGNKYTLTFEWAAGQFTDRTGETTSNWEVYFGNQAPVSTEIKSVGSKGFNDWSFKEFTFEAKNTTETLAFLAKGTPTGEPPFAMIDNISLVPVTPVPEPETYALMGLGLVALVARRRAKK
ncbi:PEP-CTERM sorting domain-containing protein [Iodobacter fluviatilis]|uniref:PEP-CTERM motif n=1 Tax=Iodobacter fluviatilis TaxID=537 RepID=A0A377Q9C4_9NEIS|nr:PEP-CTERM sorting domain-containing protein [Iodobacter fluviatilis]TCU81779.1 putative secreted protein with PEP-CTERM sorting signal [Iodobacter fluviatilis]STQ91886.1 PEP-CTERM motif [Iodobacter fluviatilis]